MRLSQFVRLAMTIPQLYRGFNNPSKYIGKSWGKAVYLSANLETAAIYGRFGETKRAKISGSLNVILASDPQVKQIGASSKPEEVAAQLGVDAIYNPESHWVGDVSPHEFILYKVTAVSYKPLTKVELAKAERIKTILAA